MIGVRVGAAGLDGRMVRRWALWVVAALVAFGAAATVTVIAVTNHATSMAWAVAMDHGFVLSCAASSLAFLAIFLRFTRSRSRVFDSLNANSYGIYLVHYAFVSWVQFALLPANLSGAVKGAIVFVTALALSWATTAAFKSSVDLFHGGQALGLRRAPSPPC